VVLGAGVVLPPEAAAQDGVEEVARQRAGPDAAGELQRAAPGEPVAALPSAAVFHPCRLQGVRPAP
jgi:hypothetical protein